MSTKSEKEKIKKPITTDDEIVEEENKSIILLVIGILLVILLIIGVISYLNFKDKDKKDNNNNKDNQKEVIDKEEDKEEEVVPVTDNSVNTYVPTTKVNNPVVTKYTVEYYNGEVLISKTEVENGKNITSITLEGLEDTQVVKYWYYLDGEGNEVIFDFESDTVTSNLKLYAKIVDLFEKIEYISEEEVTGYDDYIDYDSETGEFTVPTDVIRFTFKVGEKNIYAVKKDNVWTFNASLEIISVKNATEGNIKEEFKDDHNYNKVSFTAAIENNDVIITETSQMKSYNNGYADEKWYGIILNLNIPLDKLESISGYSIESIDREFGNLFGASENEVLLWLKGSDENTERSIVFENTESGQQLTVVIKFNSVLAKAKETAKEELEDELEKYTEEDYTEENWILLNSHKTTGDTTIDNATTLLEVETAKNNAIVEMDSVKTNEELLDDAKTQAKSELATELLLYSEIDYLPENWTLLNNHKTDGDTAIDSATNIPAVESAKTEAIENMEKVEKIIPEDD